MAGGPTFVYTLLRTPEPVGAGLLRADLRDRVG